MRYVGLISVCLIRLFTQLNYSTYGQYWYYLGQSIFETYMLFFALLFTIDKIVFYPIFFFFILSGLNLLTDINGFSFGYYYPILIALLLTFSAYLWKHK
jgi:hypothetical protein